MQASTLKILKIHEMAIKSILPQQDWHFKNSYTIILSINRNICHCPTDNEFFYNNCQQEVNEIINYYG